MEPARKLIDSLGYGEPAYVHSLREFGVARRLERSGGWLLERTTPFCGYRDAMGCYPVFACPNWKNLAADIDSLAGELVSVVLVTDPFGGFTASDLDAAFDEVRPFKVHLVRDLADRNAGATSASTRRNVAKARRQLDLEVCPRPSIHFKEWTRLYEGLCERHSIRGIRAFSDESFRKLLDVPGLVMLRASYKGETVGLHLWLLAEGVAYGHLGATNELGYRHMAAYALYDFAVEHFSSCARWMSLGADAGVGGESGNGLLQFKRRWATGIRQVFLCRRILQADKYEELVAASGVEASGYFPAYRANEFS